MENQHVENDLDYGIFVNVVRYLFTLTGIIGKKENIFNKNEKQSYDSDYENENDVEHDSEYDSHYDNEYYSHIERESNTERENKKLIFMEEGSLSD